MVTDSSTKSGDKAYIRIKVIAGGERREEAGHLCILHLLVHQGIGHTHTHTRRMEGQLGVAWFEVPCCN